MDMKERWNNQKGIQSAPKESLHFVTKYSKARGTRGKVGCTPHPPLYGYSMECVAHPLLSIWSPSVLSTWLDKSVYFLFWGHCTMYKVFSGSIRSCLEQTKSIVINTGQIRSGFVQIWTNHIGSGMPAGIFSNFIDAVYRAISSQAHLNVLRFSEWGWEIHEIVVVLLHIAPSHAEIRQTQKHSQNHNHYK